MNFLFTIIFIFALSNIGEVCSQDPKGVGKPQFSLQAAGGGNNAKNWGAGFQAGVGTKVWESKNKKQSLDIGATYSRGFVRHEGHTYKSKPSYGFGVNYRFGRK